MRASGSKRKLSRDLVALQPCSQFRRFGPSTPLQGFSGEFVQHFGILDSAALCVLVVGIQLLYQLLIFGCIVIDGCGETTRLAQVDKALFRVSLQPVLLCFLNYD